MCGIVAGLGPAAAVRDAFAAADPLAILARRGPDGAGVATVELPGGRLLVLGQTRLAVVDRRTLPLPFRFRGTGGLLLAYNGEVYNAPSLRAELSDGLPWETDCDAEVVARAWRRWGPGCLERLNGMFAFALYDPGDEVYQARLFLARDRAGEKPLYWTLHGGALFVASEIKALPVPLVEGPCPELDAFEFDCGRSTPFRGVFSLPPATCALVDVAEDPPTVCDRPWWCLPDPAEDTGEAPAGIARAEAVRDLADLVADAVRIRLPSEVPLAVLLSGGLDSAIIQAVARAEHVYCATFPAHIDNAGDALLCTFGGELHGVTFGLDNVLADLDRVAYTCDTPATWTAVALHYLYKAMRADGHVVALSGEGADEAFWGYSRYRALWHIDRLEADPVLRGYAPLKAHLLGGREADLLGRLLCRGTSADARLTTREIAGRLGIVGQSLVANMARIDWHTTMQVLLRMADRAAGAVGMENRSPFLDVRVVEAAAALHPGLKIDERNTKAILRDVATRLGVPAAVAYSTTKRGLAIPWGAWTGAVGPRGTWDRSSFAEAMHHAWRTAFGLAERPAAVYAA